MSTKVTYHCDFCGNEQSTTEQLWQVAVQARHYGHGWSPADSAKSKADACRKCAERLGLVQLHVLKNNPPTPPTLEELVLNVLAHVGVTPTE